MINKGFGRDDALNVFLRDLHFMMARLSFRLVAVHIPGVSNVIADSLSRDMAWSPDSSTIGDEWVRESVPSVSRELVRATLF